ncbi:MAG: hypothetical protein QG670_280 [Thermoproteota archaeon]|nr:hypothetical protein [Thermoproteota archaeon]
MAKVHVKLNFLGRSDEMNGEKMIEAKELSEVMRLIRDSYPLDYYTFLIFKNGVKVEDEHERLGDGDEVVVTPVFSGG